MKRRGAAIGVLAVALGAAPAAASGVDGLLERAGALRHVQSWPEVDALARERAAARLDAEAWRLLEREVAGAFAPPRLLLGVSNAPGLDPGAVGALDALARGFEGHGVASLLGAPDGFTAAALRGFPAFASGVSAAGVEPARLAWISRLDDHSGYGRNAWRTSTAVARALARGARALACAERADGGGWQAPLSAREAGDLRERREPFRERVHVELLFAARERSLADLRDAARFLESDAARAFHAWLGQAVHASLDAAARELRARLAPEVARRCSR